jgi:hypothetical protein
MPIISQFYGIKISMFYNEHGEPHYHVYYGEYNAKISIAKNKVIAGSLPKRALKLTLEWAEKHVEELGENWKRSKKHKVLNFIEPLE